MDHIEECGMTEMPGEMPPAPMDQGNPVTVNVNMNASGKDNVADLLKMMQHAGLGDAEPVSAKTLAPRLDMERLRGIVDGPEMDEPAMKLPAPESDMEEDEGYANAPDEEYGDIEDVTASGDDLHKSKKGYKAAAGGDNPMSFEDEIKERLMAALDEKKAKPDFLDVDKDGDKEEPMKKAIKDKGSKPKKGEVPAQFKKK